MFSGGAEAAKRVSMRRLPIVVPQPPQQQLPPHPVSEDAADANAALRDELAAIQMRAQIAELKRKELEAALHELADPSVSVARTVELIKLFPASAAVAEQGCWALSNIASHSAGELAAMQARAPATAVAAMVAHASISEIAEYGCWALTNTTALPAGKQAAIVARARDDRGSDACACEQRHRRRARLRCPAQHHKGLHCGSEGGRRRRRGRGNCCGHGRALRQRRRRRAGVPGPGQHHGIARGPIGCSRRASFRRHRGGHACACGQRRCRRVGGVALRNMGLQSQIDDLEREKEARSAAECLRKAAAERAAQDEAERKAAATLAAAEQTAREEAARAATSKIASADTAAAEFSTTTMSATQAVKLQTMFPGNAVISLQGCSALNSIALGLPAGKQADVDARGPAAIVAAMRAHSGRAAVVLHGCWALGKMLPMPQSRASRRP